MLLDEDLQSLGLGTRATNVLNSAGIKTVGELVKLSIDELLAIRSCGEPTAIAIWEALARNDLQMRGTSHAVSGVTELRDRFAIAALTGLLSHEEYNHNTSFDQISEWSYLMADSMLLEREKPCST